MGVLRVKVDGQWVDVGVGTSPSLPIGSSYVTDPAYAGPRRDSAPGAAQFGNKAFGGRHGLVIQSDGAIAAIASTGKPFYMTTVGADGVTEDWVAEFRKNAMQVSDLSVGVHPTHTGYMGMWAQSRLPNDYMIISNGGSTHVNGVTDVRLRIGNADYLACYTGSASFATGAYIPWVEANSTGPTGWAFYSGSGAGLYLPNGRITLGGRVESSKAGGDWTQVGFSNYQQSGTSGMSFHCPGLAPQINSQSAAGERLQALNLYASGWVPINASAFVVSSSQTKKRNVRTLCTRERIIVNHHVESDIVPEPDIMSLKPVAFRVKIPPLRIVPTDPSGEYDTIKTEDRSTWEGVPWGLDTVFGREGARERLGLIAEEVETVIPSAVDHDIDGNAMGIDYAQITVALLHHVQQLTEEVATLRYRITELEGAPS